MAEEFSIAISGIDEACAMLDRVPKETVKVAFSRALAAAAVPIVETLNATTPEDTGELVDHLRTDIAISADGKGGKASINFGDQGYIANFVEYGHRMVGHEPDLKDLGNVKPHPFMRPAASSAAEAAVEEFERSLRETLVTGTDWASLPTDSEEAA